MAIEAGLCQKLVGGMGAEYRVLPWVEIDAWAKMSRSYVLPSTARLIRMFSAEYADELNMRADKMSPLRSLPPERRPEFIEEGQSIVCASDDEIMKFFDGIK